VPPYFVEIRKEKEMKSGAKGAMFLSLGVTALLFSGCGEKKVENTEVPKGPDTNETVQAAAPAPVPTSASEEKYVVQKGDTLWAIADQSGNYSDYYEWPLLFKTNRDEIQDPDQITPGQVLIIQRGQTAVQTEHTRQLASDTPAFVSHEEPRTTLPVNYF
jgi:LysM repeat protein